MENIFRSVAHKESQPGEQEFIHPTVVSTAFVDNGVNVNKDTMILPM